MATVRAWCRADLAGGTLDIWPLGLFHPGARTVNLALDLAVTVQIEPLPAGRGYRVSQGESALSAASLAELTAAPDGALVGTVAAALDLPPFAATLASESPRGGGLGASSAMAVALIAAAEEAFDLPRTSAAAKVHLARDLEARLMGLPTGIQDHYPALLGGVLEIAALPGGERVRSLPVDLEALGDRLLIVYSGQSHFSAGQNWQVVRRRLDGEAEVTALFEGIAAVAAELPAALEAGDWQRVGELVGQEWSYRRRLAAGVSIPQLETLLDRARALGAWGGKACGAGGGGCLAILCPPDRRAAVAAAMEEAGGRVLQARPIGAQPQRT
jgi:D-glycero-alpha-D-manno-heptose-7-phosphate kinase